MAERKVSDDSIAKKAESQINLEFFEREYETIGIVRVHHPSLEVSNQIDLYYTEQFNKLLTETELPTVNELDERLQERGSWTNEHDSKLAKLQEAIRNTYFDIAQANLKKQKAKGKANKSKFDALIEQYNDKVIKFNAEYIKLVTLKTQLFQGTVEKVAEKNCIFKKIILCVTDIENKPIWNSIEELMTGTKTRYMEQLFTDAERFWSGLENPLSEQLLEAVHGS